MSNIILPHWSIAIKMTAPYRNRAMRWPAVLLATVVFLLPRGSMAGGPTTRPAARYDVTGPQRDNGVETWIVTSDYQHKPCNLYVILPDRLDKTTRYKVLYLLPAWAPSRDGINEARQLDLANRFNLICVGPDFSSDPWYVDNEHDPRIRYDSYIPDVIVPLIDKHYPTIAKPDGRLVVGFSKSGLGALSLLLRHPDVFGRAGSWDGILIMDNRPEFYGSPEHFAGYYLPNLLRQREAMLKSQPARIAITGYGDLKRANDDAHALMESLKIPHYFDNSTKRRHEWTSGWLLPLVEVLMADDMGKWTDRPRAK